MQAIKSLSRPVLLLSLLAIASLSCAAKDRTASKATAGEALGAAYKMEAPAALDEAEKDADQEARKKGKSTWKRSTLVANTSRLMIGDNEELPIRGMQVHARVDGFRARVLIDFYFKNDRQSRYEGTFKMRLPNGASPYFLAFGQSKFEDARYAEAAIARGRGFAAKTIVEERAAEWIQPKIARMVPREKAAEAYKAVVRRQVDPALMEWAGAGVFNARIFPIEPGKLHRVVVGYDVNLTRIADDLEFQLPMPAGLPSSAVDLDIGNLKGASINVAIDGTSETKAAKDGNRTYYRLERLAGQLVTVRLQGASSVALTGAEKSGEYFAARVAPTLPAAGPDARPTSAVFAVDTSLSSNPDKFNVWLSLLRATLDNNRDTINEFAVLFFNIETHWWQTKLVANTPQNVAALMSYANTLALEGATDLGAAIKEAASLPWLDQEVPEPRNLFLLSDGAVTWGQGDAYAISRHLHQRYVAALFAYRTGMSGTDSRMLDHLARESGGAVFSVVGESEVAAASRAHTVAPWTITKVAMDGASDILLAGRPRVVFPGQRLYVVGRGKVRPGAKLILGLEQSGRKKTISVPIAHTVESVMAPRAYGQLAVGQLEDFLGSTEAFAGAYARHFRVTGKTTSLLMLDTEEDYRRYDIKPADDAGVVQRTKAQALVAEALQELAEVLGDAKHAFLKTAKLPNEARDLLAQLPQSAFEVDAPRLITKEQTWKPISASLREQLRLRKPDYDTITAVAERRRKSHGGADALEALSSLVEANPGDAVLARDIGFSAMQWGLHAHAYHLFRRVANARPFEPQTYWAMALALAEMDQHELALAYFEIAMTGDWDSRFGEFQRIVMMDYIRFLSELQYAKLAPAVAAYASKRLANLRRLFGVQSADLLVTIMWNTDNTDVDLHVIEPSGEECYYGHRRTNSGGQMTQDVTRGYGPEMFTHTRAPKGKYQVRAHYFASDRNRASARTKVYATIYRNWGSSNERVERKIVTLAYGKDKHDIVTLDLP